MTGMEWELVGTYELVAGFGILGWWALEWASHGKASLLSYGASHILAELVAFSSLVLGGILLIVGGPYTSVVVPASLGMLLYATINALGRVGRESGRLATVMVAESIITAALIGIIAMGA